MRKSKFSESQIVAILKEAEAGIREAIGIMTEGHGVPVTRACGAARLSRAAYYRTGVDRAVRDRPVIEALNEIVAVELRWGFWKCYDRLRQIGRPWKEVVPSV